MKKILTVIVLVASLGTGTGTVIAISQGNSRFELNTHSSSASNIQHTKANVESEPLTIVSFNLRDIRGTERTLEDFQELAELMEDADIIVFQEMGAKGFGTTGKNEEMMERLHATTSVFESYLGDEWEFIFAETPTPETLGSSAEIPCIGFRTTWNAATINASWIGYYDLGEARDMGMFQVVCSKGKKSEAFTIGTVHTKPTCPERGFELLRIADYIEAHENENYILLGDFNWGYYSTCSNKYDGEKRLMQQHDQGKVLQVFNAISYTGKGKDENFRTNLDVRTTPQMYDQFFVCKNYVDRLEKSNGLGEDFGFVSFSTGPYFQSRVDDIVREQLKGVKAYMRSQGYKSKDPETKAALEAAEAEIRSSWLVQDEASYKMSDHKPIWMCIQIFE